MNTGEFSKKFNKVQPIIGFVILLLMVLFAYKLHTPKLIFGLLAGLGFGYTLTRSRFGFAGGIKRIYVRGEGSLTKALLISFAVITLIYGAIQWTASTKGALPAFLAKMEKR